MFRPAGSMEFASVEGGGAFLDQKTLEKVEINDSLHIIVSL